MFQSNHYANHYENNGYHDDYEDDLRYVPAEDEEEVHVFDTSFEADAVPIEVKSYADDITQGMVASGRRGSAVFPYDPNAVSPRVAELIAEKLPDMFESAMAKVAKALHAPDDEGKLSVVARRDNTYHTSVVGLNMVTHRPHIDPAYLASCVRQLIDLPAQDDLGIPRRYDEDGVARVGEMLIEQVEKDFMPLLKSSATKAAETYMHPVGYGAPDVYVDDDLVVDPDNDRYDQVYRDYAGRDER